ncbi:MAG: hypothetical protein JW809_19485 [Pirellulales bacterium]|nr:hypothetical protein [Pirellulales bacterium]
MRKSQGDRLTEARRRAFRARLKSRQWREDYPKALAKFPLPCTVGDDSWKPDLDWFLRPDSVTRILEGKYDFTKAASRSPPAVARCGPGQRHPADIRDQPGTF